MLQGMDNTNSQQSVNDFFFFFLAEATKSDIRSASSPKFSTKKKKNPPQKIPDDPNYVKKICKKIGQWLPGSNYRVRH